MPRISESGGCEKRPRSSGVLQRCLLFSHGASLWRLPAPAAASCLSRCLCVAWHGTAWHGMAWHCCSRGRSQPGPRVVPPGSLALLEQLCRDFLPHFWKPSRRWPRWVRAGRLKLGVTSRRSKPTVPGNVLVPDYQMSHEERQV